MARQQTTTRSTGASALVGALERQGIPFLFGVPGHGAYPIYDALNDFPSVRPIVGRNEQGAIFAADGYSRATEDVAVATSVPRAGVTNSMTGLWEADGAGSRLLYVIEHDPIHHDRVARAAELLSEASRPLIFAGGQGWALHATEALTRLADTLRAPVLVTSGTKGVISDDHPLGLGFNWDV